MLSIKVLYDKLGKCLAKMSCYYFRTVKYRQHLNKQFFFQSERLAKYLNIQMVEKINVHLNTSMVSLFSFFFILSSSILCVLSHAWLFVAPWTAVRQAPLSIGFSRQEYWSGLPFPSPGDLLHSLLHWQADSLPLRHLSQHSPSAGVPILKPFLFYQAPRCLLPPLPVSSIRGRAISQPMITWQGLNKYFLN